MQEDDPTKSYPFPVPRDRNPATNNDSFLVAQEDESSGFAINTAQSQFITDDSPFSDDLHTNTSAHTNVTSLTSLMKYQIAKPPIATRSEVKDARLKLREKYLLSMSVVSIKYSYIHTYTCSYI